MEINQQQQGSEGARELTDYQDLLGLTLEVRVIAEKLEALQQRLTQKLTDIAERQGFEADEVWARTRA